MNKCHSARACERLAPELLGVVGADACDRGVGSQNENTTWSSGHHVL